LGDTATTGNSTAFDSVFLLNQSDRFLLHLIEIGGGDR
jgi:hypothetical protein